MRDTLVKAFLAVLLLSAPAYAQVHDCRIASVDMRATHKDGSLFLRAIYRGYDGRPLRQDFCPDQNIPTWGTDRDVTYLDEWGFLIRLEGVPGEVVEITLATWQGPTETFERVKRFCF